MLEDSQSPIAPSAQAASRLRRLGRISWFVALALLGALSLFHARHSHALSEAGSLDAIKFTIYAPDWTWQKRDINILVVVENKGAATAEIGLQLSLPEGKEEHFGRMGEAVGITEESLRQTIEVSPGQTVRAAFTSITALDGFPRQLYHFKLRVSQGERHADVTYPVRTVRGAVVSPGNWALYLPAGVALAWCAVFFVVMRRFARPGAWRVPAEPVGVPEEQESWISQTPE